MALGANTLPTGYTQGRIITITVYSKAGRPDIIEVADGTFMPLLSGAQLVAQAVLNRLSPPADPS